MTTVDRTKRPLPRPTPETQHFWDGTRDGRLLIQRCTACGGPYFPPRPFCPACSSHDVVVEQMSGRGTLYSYLINHTGHPGIEGPYSIAVVQLDEGIRMMTNIVNCDQTPEALVIDMPVEVVFESFSDTITLPFFQPVDAGSRAVSGPTLAVVGAAETTQLGRITDTSELQLHADAAFNVLADAGLTIKDIDGFATAGERPTDVADYLGLTPRWVDGTSVGGCSFMIHVRHAAAAIAAGLCSTVLITHAESGRSRVGKVPQTFASAMSGQFERPFGVTGPPTMFGLPVLRHMHDTGLTHEQMANVAVVQREWAGMNPRATFRDPITIDDVLSSRMIAYPFHLLECCLVTDGGGASIVTSADRARDFPNPPVYVLGHGEGVETPMVSQMENFSSSKAFRIAGRDAFASAGITTADVDHLMVYDAFAHLPLYGLEDLGFCGRGEAGDFVWERNTAPGGSLPMNTNGGGLSYMHSGMYGMYAMQESVRQMRGIAPAQVAGAEISVSLGVGGMFGAAGCVVFGNVAP